MFITLYIIIGLILVSNEKRKKITLYAAGHQKTAAYSVDLFAAVFMWPAAYGALFKIGHLLLSLLLGAKIAAYYGQKTAINEVFSTSERIMSLFPYIN